LIIYLSLTTLKQREREITMWDNNDISFTSNSKTSGIDAILSTNMIDLVGRKNKKEAATFKEGSRVVAFTNNGIVIPGQLPSSGTKGTVVTVETVNGPTTHLGNEIFVRFDGRNKIDNVPADFLKLASMKVSNLDEHFIILSGPSLMSHIASGENALVHKSTKDLWSVKVSEDGTYDVERLFDDDGNPLKV
jgi:hypothetical protein